MTAPLVVKWRYWNNSKSRAERSGNYLNYIGMREGVEKFDDTWSSKSVTEKQQKLIGQIIKDVPSVADTEEYLIYLAHPTCGTAHDVISSALDDHPRLLDKKTYLDYIGTRPRAERTGKHGLFSDDGTVIDLDTERDKLNAFTGNVHTLIISLSREDAEATGFNCAARYRSFLRSQKEELAKQFDIPAESFHWFGAFHNESSHPHIHVLLYSSDSDFPGYLKKSGLERIKQSFAREIFRNELDSIYETQKKQRDELTVIARDEIAELVMSIRSNACNDPNLMRMMTELSEKLKTVSGKKVYGYLPPEMKTLVDQITDELCKDERLKRLYDLWYESRYAVLRKYTMHLPDKKPLSQEETFKPIRNAVIREAEKLADDSYENMKSKNIGNYSKSNAVAHAAARVLINAGQILEDRIEEQLDRHPELAVDSRLRREIEAKRRGENLVM